MNVIDEIRSWPDTVIVSHSLPKEERGVGIRSARLKELADSHQRLKLVVAAYMSSFIANDGHPDDTEMTREMQAAVEEAERLTKP